ncbi:MAG: 6-oxocyclohex-1-ene-1-carbonyl-CoA hydratase [Desulfarculaceae bacterium]|nr:6-oxocyclohex-1-ene-1-carbonyl-CoA hydratase [Desulfarculaceae bacterium]MCF8071439.1 6-oxocyclohex-1-ene-1-carbonyl-CoA hydratase [Desulfarculaceae bacterium]MCF8103433.1 6-oxocyclohex-1-ene-1-carbonyl-CoA hydratase [Desulfarculaceae bacterium]MCF8117826.1 6-oxocyclohex-1-ene-1-carbonyl-CoA hydratase [Desulfarculaceae bacterium]
MSLDWMPREHELKNHLLFEEDMVQGRYWGTDDDAPCVVYTKKPLVNPKTGEEVPDLYVAEVRLNNPRQYNSYTTTMVKGVIAGFRAASGDRSVVATVFTATGYDAFCTGGNTKEYSEYYSKRPNEYGEYMDLFNEMVDSILMCKKPTLCRVNGMRVAGGQEIGMACDLAVTSDLAIFGQAGARHGSAPDGGSTDFLPWMLNMEDAMWNCVSCEMWSAYKMRAKNLVSKVVPMLKDGDKFIRNPMIITDRYVEDGEIVYGEFLRDKAALGEAKAKFKELPKDPELLDKECNKIIWTLANLFPGCVMKSIDGIRAKKKYFWDQAKLPNRHWLMANMNYEAFLGFGAFNTKKITGTDVIDFIKFRQAIANGAEANTATFAEVMGKPKD